MKRMSTSERRRWVRRLARGSCTQAEIARTLKTTESTVSRDIAWWKKERRLW